MLPDKPTIFRILYCKFEIVLKGKYYFAFISEDKTKDENTYVFMNFYVFFLHIGKPKTPNVK